MLVLKTSPNFALPQHFVTFGRRFGRVFLRETGRERRRGSSRCWRLVRRGGPSVGRFGTGVLARGIPTGWDPGKKWETYGKIRKKHMGKIWENEDDMLTLYQHIYCNSE